MTERNQGFWEAKLLVHLEEKHRHEREAEFAREYLKAFHPESHLVVERHG